MSFWINSLSKWKISRYILIFKFSEIENIRIVQIIIIIIIIIVLFKYVCLFSLYTLDSVTEETSTPKTCRRCRKNDERPTGTDTTIARIKFRHPIRPAEDVRTTKGLQERA